MLSDSSVVFLELSRRVSTLVYLGMSTMLSGLVPCHLWCQEKKLPWFSLLVTGKVKEPQRGREGEWNMFVNVE